MVGILVGLFLLDYLKPVSPIVFMVGFVVSAVLPDIDYPKSVVGRKVRSVSTILNFFFGHRGFLHTIYPSLLLFFILVIFQQHTLAVAVVFGYALHLMLDALTIDGVKFFWPFWRARFKGWLRTGGVIEIVILIGVLVALVFKIKFMLF